MLAVDGGAFAANVQVVLAHRAFAEGQVEGRYQTPAPVATETFETDGLNPRGIKIKGEVTADTHIRPSSTEALAAP